LVERGLQARRERKENDRSECSGQWESLEFIAFKPRRCVTIVINNVRTDRRQILRSDTPTRDLHLDGEILTLGHRPAGPWVSHGVGGLVALSDFTMVAAWTCIRVLRCSAHLAATIKTLSWKTMKKVLLIRREHCVSATRLENLNGVADPTRRNTPCRP
jgi:hypothetical protein